MKTATERNYSYRNNVERGKSVQKGTDFQFNFWNQGLSNPALICNPTSGYPKPWVAEEHTPAFSKNSLFALYFSHGLKFLFQCKRLSKYRTSHVMQNRSKGNSNRSAQNIMLIITSQIPHSAELVLHTHTH